MTKSIAITFTSHVRVLKNVPASIAKICNILFFISNSQNQEGQKDELQLQYSISNESNTTSTGIF